MTFAEYSFTASMWILHLRPF